MTQRRNLHCLCLLFLALSTLHADDDLFKFFGDGHDWKQMGTPFAKAIYIDGFRQGLSYAAMMLREEPLTAQDISETSKAIGEDQITPNKPVPRIAMVAAVESFYSDPRNVNVSIPMALRWAKVKLDGEATVDDLAALAALLRTNQAEEEKIQKQ